MSYRNVIPNPIASPELSPTGSSSSAQFIGRWIRCQCPLPAAVGELGKTKNERLSRLNS